MRKAVNRIPLTTRGAALLREELIRLKQEERPKIIAAIAEARSHGDLSENAEYHAAKERQGFVENRIKTLEHTLSWADVIDCATLTDYTQVVFGMTVQLKDFMTDDTVQYQIVGEEEANIKLGRLSLSAPLARALIGKELGEVITVQTPNGLKEYEITAITSESTHS